MRLCGKIYNGPQGTPEWDGYRIGKITASRLAKIVPGKTGKRPASWDALKVEIITERLTGIKKPMFQTEPMKWGVYQEQFADIEYQMVTGVVTSSVSFIDHPSIPNSGASPDRVIYDSDGRIVKLIEIKCPNSETHFATALSGTHDPDYEDQMLMQMGCSGADLCDFVSFDPRLPKEMQILIVPFEFDIVKWEYREQLIIEFLKEVDDDLVKIKKRFGMAV